MIIQTNLSIAHLELIKIFFEANELPNVGIHEYLHDIRGVKHSMLQLGWADDDEETCTKITYMALVHLGVQNMLDDYLMKCGVPVHDLPPTTIRQQEFMEREAQRDKDFNEHFNQRKQSIQSGQNP